MPLFKGNLGLYTDFYELTMAQGYYLRENKELRACFDYYFRTNAFKGGYMVFAGLQDVLNLLKKFSYGKSDIDFLEKQGFDKNFLDYLSHFKFTGDIYSVNEGEIVFPNEPVLRVEGTLIECQLIESLILNILNFESLVATKSFRTKLVSGKKVFADFGLRRAQGFGSIHASRAAIIGGASSTSNVLAAKIYNLPVTGTQAHSWIQSFESEIEAFRAFASVNPNNTILLVDTFNTIESGIPNAILVAHEMEQKGLRLKAIRLDSGDLAYLSKKARKMLDAAGLKYVQIIASNQLNELVIKSLLHDQNAQIDAFGIGTELITAKPDAALDGVYKLAELNGIPKMKFSENIEKVTLPGKKQLARFFDENDMFYRDLIFLEEENPNHINKIFHPVYPEKNTTIKNLKFEILLKPVVLNGIAVEKEKSPTKIHQFLIKRSQKLPGEHKRFISPHIYKVGISKKLMEMRSQISQQFKTNS